MTNSWLPQEDLDGLYRDSEPRVSARCLESAGRRTVNGFMAGATVGGLGGAGGGLVMLLSFAAIALSNSSGGGNSSTGWAETASSLFVVTIAVVVVAGTIGAVVGAPFGALLGLTRTERFAPVVGMILAAAVPGVYLLLAASQDGGPEAAVYLLLVPLAIFGVIGWVMGNWFTRLLPKDA